MNTIQLSRSTTIKKKIFRSKSQVYQQENSAPRERNSKKTRSLIAVEGHIQCPICKNTLTSHRMLPCQHTFCLSCLEYQLINHRVQTNDMTPSIRCFTCSDPCPVPAGIDSIRVLPENVYIQSLLDAYNGKVDKGAQRSIKSQGHCAKCQIACMIENEQYQNCHHCRQKYCNVCFPSHVAELKEQRSEVLQQLHDSESKLHSKQQDVDTACIKMKALIAAETIEKIDSIKRAEDAAIQSVNQYAARLQISADFLRQRITNTINEVGNQSESESQTLQEQVNQYMTKHRTTSRLLDEISNWGDCSKLVFNTNSFTVEVDNQPIADSSFSAEDAIDGWGTTTSADHYRVCSFHNKLTWTNCPRPAGIAISPWNPELLYIATIESRSVIIFNMTLGKVVGKLSTTKEMKCPTAIAFDLMHNEICVSDQWTHKIFVYDKEGVMRRTIPSADLRSPHGICWAGTDHGLYVADSGNNRVVLINTVTGVIKATVDSSRHLKTPTDVALSPDFDSLVVVDNGNNRAKVYDGRTYRRRFDIGSYGRSKGEFVAPEVCHFDLTTGDILVGDGGSGRVQVFNSKTGALVRVFSGNAKLLSVTGMAVSNNMEIVVTDHKSRTLRIFDTKGNVPPTQYI